MLSRLIFIITLTFGHHSYAFMSSDIEQINKTCNDFIYKLYIAKKEYNPTLQDIKEKLGSEKTKTEHTHTYHWKKLTVIFLNDTYIEHYGTMHTNFQNITPEDLISVYGKPIRITHSTNDAKSWKCHYTLSNLEVIINEFDQILRYTGKYCSRNHPDFCRNFDFIANKTL